MLFVSLVAILPVIANVSLVYKNLLTTHSLCIHLLEHRSPFHSDMRTSALSFALLYLAFAASSVTAQNATSSAISTGSTAASVTSATVSPATSAAPSAASTSSMPTANLALSSFLANYTASPTSSSNPYSSITTCCGDYLNTLELCVKFLNAGNSTFNAVGVQLYECACAQGQSFYNSFSSCLNCVGTTAGYATTADNVQQACQNLTSNHSSFPTVGGNIPLSALQALPSPTGTLAVTAWPGHGAGEKVVAQTVMAVGMVAVSVVVMLL